jgi:hypothetical protein
VTERGGAAERKIGTVPAELERARQIHRLDLESIGADGELDIVQSGTPLAEFYRLSMAATAKPLIAAGIVAPDDAAELVARLDKPDFLACGFAFIGAWGRRKPA